MVARGLRYHVGSGNEDISLGQFVRSHPVLSSKLGGSAQLMLLSPMGQSRYPAPAGGTGIIVTDHAPCSCSPSRARRTDGNSQTSTCVVNWAISSSLNVSPADVCPEWRQAVRRRVLAQIAAFQCRSPTRGGRRRQNGRAASEAPDVNRRRRVIRGICRRFQFPG